ncbi:neurolysin [Penicillium canescens]|nr:neurolysin [Penicillium canescens]
MAMHHPSSHKNIMDTEPDAVYGTLLQCMTGLLGQGELSYLALYYVLLCFALLIWIWIWIWIWILGLTYYSTRILSADIWNSIFFGDLMNPEASLRYRRMILDWGGSRDEMDGLGMLS